MPVMLGCFYGLMWDRKDGLGDKFIIICRELLVHAQTSKLVEEAFI
jgi:hypothetical protein